MENIPNSAREYRISIKPDHIRTFNNPHNEDIKIIHAYVRVIDFPHSKIPDEINPRRHETLKGQVPQGIKESLENRSELFHLFNRGMLVIAQKAYYDNKSNTLHFFISSNSEGGLADGATTDRVIGENKNSISITEFEKLTQDEIPEYLKNAYVHIEIITGMPAEYLVDLTEARNKSLQVKEFALEDLRGGYDNLKSALDKSKFKSKIRYRENDLQDVDIRTVLGILILFHPKWAEVDREPTIAYTSKGSVLTYFQDDEWKKGFEALAPIAADILELHNHMHLNFPIQYKKSFGDGPSGKARLGGRKEVKISKSKKSKDKLISSHPLLFEKVQYGIPDGWIYPLLASFRPLVSWPKNPKGTAEWITEPKKFFDNNGHKLIEDLVEMSESLGRNANATGKQRGLWKMLRTNVTGIIAEN